MLWFFETVFANTLNSEENPYPFIGVVDVTFFVNPTHSKNSLSADWIIGSKQGAMLHLKAELSKYADLINDSFKFNLIDMSKFQAGDNVIMQCHKCKKMRRFSCKQTSPAFQWMIQEGIFRAMKNENKFHCGHIDSVEDCSTKSKRTAGDTELKEVSKII